jgi:hypothetical protein
MRVRTFSHRVQCLTIPQFARMFYDKVDSPGFLNLVQGQDDPHGPLARAAVILLVENGVYTNQTDESILLQASRAVLHR